MPPYLPPRQPAGYDRVAATNTGDLGFMTLPIERTIGGFRDNLFDPRSNPFPGGFTEDNEFQGLAPDFNPYQQGYFSGGEFKPYLPDKIIVGSRRPTSPVVGRATQFINGKEYNVNGNNYAAGTDAPAPYQFKISPGDARTSDPLPPVFSGFQFGEQGKLGARFSPGVFSGGSFFARQPEYAPNRNLGIFQTFNPSLAALQQNRSNP